jgi:subtilisin family serine protease
VNAIPQLGLTLVETSPGADLAQAADILEASAGAEWSEPNYIFSLDSAGSPFDAPTSTDLIPNDPYYSSAQDPYLSRLKMPQAWEYATGRPEAIIAILDTGLDMNHEDLRDGIWTNPGEIADNGIDDDGNGFVDDVHGWNFPDGNHRIYDDYGHGTHVAGIAAARINNGIGIAGMAGGATIMPVDVFNVGIGTYEDLIRAIVYATDNGARVINMSLGATSYSRGEEMAVDYAWSHGVVLAASAGNTGRENAHYPAAHENVIAVAATAANDSLCGFSTRGDFVDVAAPGCSVWSTVPGGYGWKSGTSMATPHVAGLAALIFSLDPSLSAAEVRALIEKNADDLGDSGPDKMFGRGRINALKSLAMVGPGTGPTPVPPAPLPEWPAGCLDLIDDGGFEGGGEGWQASGDVAVDATRAYSGTQAAHFFGGPDAHGLLTRTVTLPAFPEEGTLWFAYRIENADTGWGSSPSWPYDDWFTAEFRSQEGQRLAWLLRTGNSADSAGDGLPWDRYVYRMQVDDLAPLREIGPVELVFTSQNDGDSAPTEFWVDAVRFCVKGQNSPRYRYYFPFWLANVGN